MKTFLGVEPTSNPSPSKGVVITMEGTSLAISIIVGALAILAVAAKAITKFNQIAEQIRDLNQLIENHRKEEGHEKLLLQVRVLQKDCASLDKRFDIHAQDYVNYKDANLLAIHGCEEQIDHKWQRAEEEFAKDRAEIKDLRWFLVKKLDFRIRDDYP
ncbi:hypothetical protein [Nostoc sp. PA-18-2419]|uniref:hypothetical protein n=1 Tax=Nostoc sp. PA-18-2419 TaxID=2575443 RepID=UPI0011092101|nr:hypothetical protein [Nostoc sp. PA-18-2419]